MADIIRLKSYKTFMNDGRSSVTYGCTKGFVAVAVILGHESAKYSPNGAIDVDEVVLSMADHIKRQRALKTKKRPKSTGPSAVESRSGR